MNRTLSWWRQTFADAPHRWRRAILEAPGEGGTAWSKAVRRWPGAEDLDREIDGVRPGPLAGVPFGVKDLFDEKSSVTLAGSILLKETGAPATEDALVLRRLRELGAVPVGRTNMNEFAYGLDGFNPHTGNCPNPRDPERISGGSSSGSAWIVGRGILPLALGTDTGGSVRVPAALCGVYGFRGVPDGNAREGVFPLARSFDTAGWFTQTAEEMLEMIELLWDGGEGGGGAQAGRPSAADAGRTGAGSAADAGRAADDAAAGALYYAPEKVELAPEVAASYRDYLQSNPWIRSGSTEARLFGDRLNSFIDEAFWAYNVIGSCEAFDVHKSWFTEYKGLYNPEVWKLIDRSRHWEPGALDFARRLQREIARLLGEILEEVGSIVMPAVHTVAPKPEEVDQPFRIEIIRLTSLASLAGLPVLTIPLETAGGLSCGLQVITKPEAVLAAARRFLTGGSR